MKITINNQSYEASKGQRVLDIARSNHAHIGYFCGGNTICQTCYVRVLEGAELLSPISDEEKALLSDPLISEGTRMACMTTVEKEGTIRVISAVEEVKRMAETNPLALTGYAAKMGREALVKFPDTMKMQAKRELDLWQLVTDVVGGIGDALQLLVTALQAPFAGSTEKNNHVGEVDTTEKCQPSCGCSSSSARITPISAKHIAA